MLDAYAKFENEENSIIEQTGNKTDSRNYGSISANRHGNHVDGRHGNQSHCTVYVICNYDVDYFYDYELLYGNNFDSQEETEAGNCDDTCHLISESKY